MNDETRPCLCCKTINPDVISTYVDQDIKVSRCQGDDGDGVVRCKIYFKMHRFTLFADFILTNDVSLALTSPTTEIFSHKI